MPSGNEDTPRLLRFPSGVEAKAAPPILNNLTASPLHPAEVRELCRDTTSALRELRSGVINVLLDIIQLKYRDPVTLTRILDERSNVVADLLAHEVDDLSTEQIIDYLDRLSSAMHWSVIPGGCS